MANGKRFVVDHAQLDRAKELYDQAITAFASAKTAFNDAAGSVDWKDDAAGEWSSTITDFNKELTKIEAKIGRNKTLIDAMQTAANSDQTKTIAGVDSIYKSS